MTTGTLDLSRVDAERRRLEGATEDLPPDGPATTELDLDADPATRAHRIVEQVLSEARRGHGEADGAPTFRGDEGSPGAVAHRIVQEVLAAEAATASRVERAERASDGADEATGSEAAHEPSWRPSQHRRHLVLLGLDDPLVLVPGPVYEPRSTAYVPDRLPVTLPGLVDRAVATVDARPATSQDVRQAISGAAESDALPGSRWLVLGVLWAAALAGATPFAAAALGSAIDFRIDLWGDEPATVQQMDSDAPATAPPIDPSS